MVAFINLSEFHVLFVMYSVAKYKSFVLLSMLIDLPVNFQVHIVQLNLFPEVGILSLLICGLFMIMYYLP